MKRLLFLGIAFVAFHASHSYTPEFCLLPKDEGSGMNFEFSLYFDQESQRCSPFMYKGEGGNANRFYSERECIRNCSNNPETLYPVNPRDACHFKKEVGKCNGNFLRFYYDSVHDKCKKFLWTGCIGNGNRFFDYDSCNATCVGVHDDGTDEEEEEPDTPIAIICGVLLAVIIASIFITVIVLTVKSKKKGSKKDKKAGGKNKDPKSDAPLQEQNIELA
ncbi:Kunitz-type U19-barytoxin-Tl1a [Larimichthys crocea]|uniref:Kunitz-type U19-barytoxin-Tl1a n=1 Tax=Larimichthys crocea TaxID=215358 RepID=A0A0F8AZQ7_LARCR|nr:kunitz-type serine protease inhibitor bitisilin-3 [Larimichthys crocea]KAE8296278.1 Kunitz-type U19-barytoxin-Tl1a [Larimichthys crocea]